MAGIPSDHLTYMRAQIAGILPDQAVINSLTNTNDSAGGITAGTVAMGTVACRLDPYVQRKMDGVVAQREGLTIEYVLTMPYDAPIAADYQVVINGHTYEVAALAAEHSQNVSKRAYLARTD